jgi:prepilin-type N-terminal cleavage/methylation domain-containing protein/prepilin-type processing-associated H-X9-DG protein
MKAKPMTLLYEPFYNGLAHVQSHPSAFHPAVYFDKKPDSRGIGHNCTTTRGFTLIEILVVITIVGILCLLVLSAVQSSRESARGLHCIANLRQVNIALINYESRYNVLPSAMAKNSPYITSAFSVFSRILTDCEQINLFNELNFEINQPAIAVAPPNQTASNRSIEIFVCPSDSIVPVPGVGPISYRINMGASLGKFAQIYEPKLHGPFMIESWAQLSQIRDGLSNTALLSERLKGDGDESGWNSKRDSWFAGIIPSPNPTTVELINLCTTPLIKSPPHYSSGGWSWMIFGYDNTSYNHVLQPNTYASDCATSRPITGTRGGSDSGSYAARSLHAQLVNVAFADGSVRSIKNSIDNSVWRAIGTCNGSDAVSY